jgi:hypothetical protein
MNSAAVSRLAAGLLCLSQITIVQAADKSRRSEFRSINIRVQAGGFGEVSAADITAVLQSAAGELFRYWPGTQLPSIDVYHRTDHPQTDSIRAAGNRIAIGLTARDNHWAQYSFQFAHEFCHVLANYSNSSRPLVRYPRHANLWLEESLCETASLFALRAMGRSWQTNPPHPAWREYAVWLDSYAKERLALAKNRLPPRTQFSVWFRENQSVLRRSPTERSRNTIIAAQLLPIFEAEPRGWEALAFLNSPSTDPKSSLTQYLAQWRSRCPQGLRSFVTKVKAVFL